MRLRQLPAGDTGSSIGLTKAQGLPQLQPVIPIRDNVYPPVMVLPARLDSAVSVFGFNTTSASVQ